MTERTEALVRELVRGLRPVRRLPPVGAIAAGISALAALLVAIDLIAGRAPDASLLKPDFGPIDVQTILVHAGLAASALAFALGEFVPGRERLKRVGRVGLGLASATLLLVAGERLAGWAGIGSLQAGWLAQTIACALGAIAPAAVPVVLLSIFAARAAPHRVARSLAFACAASVALLTLPGILRCDYPDALHHVVGHLLAPALGAGLLLALALPVFLIARSRPRV